MNREIKLAAFTLTFTSALEGYAQTIASSPVSPAPVASGPASGPVTQGAPGGGVTWFVAGLAIGLVVGYIAGKNVSSKTA